MRPFRPGLLVAAAAALAAAPGPASGVPLLYQFSGTITSIDASLAGSSPPFAVTDSVSGTAQIDSSTPGINAGNGINQYLNPTSVSLTLNGVYTVNGNPPSSSISVQDQAPGSQDEFRIVGSGLSGGATIGVFAPSSFTMLLNDAGGTALATNALPTSLQIGDWPSTSLTMAFIDTVGSLPTQQVTMSVTAVSVGVVPEPGTAGLLVAGLLGLAFRRRATA